MDEELLELYHRIMADVATNFAMDATDILVENLKPQDVLVLNITDKRAIYPNDYSSLLVPTLQNRSYNPILHPVEIDENGTLFRHFPPSSVVRDKPIIFVDVHFSPRLGLYLPYALEKGASRAFYASPTPPPSSVWEYKEGRLIQLKRSGLNA